MSMTSRPIGARTSPAFAVTMIVALAALAGCAGRDQLQTGALPDDYRTRHPIVIGEAERAIDIPIASSDRRLTLGMRDAVRGFATEYGHASSGAIQIVVPQGSFNAAAASAAAKEIRSILVQKGIPAKRILRGSYDASGSDNAAPIRLTYMAITATTETCGQWPEDLISNTVQNKNYYNFGCATQSNLAAQIANPMDLVAPRDMSPIDAQRRSNVIGDYRDSGSDL